MSSDVLLLGSCLDMLPTLADSSVDAIVTDPPYHLTQPSRGSHTGAPDTPQARARIGDKGFMGMQWDGGDIAFRPDVWRECLRVLKPGGHLLAFSGSRTYHRMVCAIEDAGFEIRDQIMWLYGSGFPKSKNLDGEWEGWGTALKPAHEPIVVARKPLEGTVAANVLAFGTGAMNIEACRVPVLDADYAHNCSGDRGHAGTRCAGEEGATNLHAGGGSAASGRWPANVIHDGSEEVLDAFVQFGERGAFAPVKGTEPSGATKSVFGQINRKAVNAFHDDKGTAARFFYCAKASRADRNEGLSSGATPAVSTNATMRERENADWAARNGNHHPTVKPTELMRYLVRLVTPPGGAVLDPFMGSGSTGKACALEGFSFIGIDITPEYVAIARSRIAAARAKAAPKQPTVDPRQIDLFEEAAAA